MKNISLAQQSIDASSTKEYSSNIKNTILTQITPSPFIPLHLNRINTRSFKNNYINLAQEEVNKNDNNNKIKEQNSASTSVKSPRNIINFNSIKLYSPRSTSNFIGVQNTNKMKLNELNSNSNKRKKEKREIKLVKSLHPELNESKMTQKNLISEKNDTFTNKKNEKNEKTEIMKNFIPLSKSSKNFFSYSQSFSCNSKSMNRNIKSKRKADNSLNNNYFGNKSTSSLLGSRKSLINLGVHSHRNYNDYLSPANKHYLGIDLNLVSNSSHKRYEDMNSQKQRYLKNYNYNNDDEDNDKDNNDDIIGYNLKSNDNYFFPKNTSNDEQYENDKFSFENNENINQFTENSKDKDINGKKSENNKNNTIINLTINKDISEINQSLYDDELNKKNLSIKKHNLNQYINRISIDKKNISKKNKKEDFNISLSNIRPISHDNNSLNQINQSTPISSFQMCPYEADSSPTNYIKSNSNANNITNLTYNNSKRYNKNTMNYSSKEQSEGQSYRSIKSKDEEDQQKSINCILNQSELININTNSEKDEERRLTEKLEHYHKIRKGKNALKLKNKNNDNNDEINEYSFKVLTIGESGVGKTAIMKRYVENKFPKQHLSTIGVDYLSKDLRIGNNKIKLRVWDTAGQERYRNITSHAYKDADGIALVFDVTDEGSFNQITDWIEQIDTNANRDEISIILIGNKIDLKDERRVEKEKGEEMAEKLKIKYFETSASTGEGINEAFEYLAKHILQIKNPDSYISRNISLSKENDNDFLNNKKRKCC